MKRKIIFIALLSAMALGGCSSSKPTSIEPSFTTSAAETTIETTAAETVIETEAEAPTETGIIATGITELYLKAFLPFADKVGTITFDEIDATVSNLGFEIEKTKPTEDDLGQFKITASDGDFVWILVYPSGDTETLSAISYDHDGMYEITINDNYHASAPEFKTYNKNLEKPNVSVGSLADCENFMFGNSSDLNIKDETSEITKKIEDTIKSRVAEKYSNSTIDEITINADLGTDSPDDYTVLVNLTWSMQNSGKTSKEVLTMYSNDLAATTAEQLPNVQEIAIFWDVPYLNDSAKCAYERKGNDMYISDTIWGKAFSE